MKPVIYYCYDAYCGWCYGFSPVITSLRDNYRGRIDFETLSGGMIPRESARHIGQIAAYVKDAYKIVEGTTGVTFGATGFHTQKKRPLPSRSSRNICPKKA
jgi:putative protein-disulfide isomerase